MPLLIYTVIRLGLTAILSVVFYQLGLGLVVGVVLGAVVAWCLSYLFFGKLRRRAGETLRKTIKNRKPHPTRTQLDDAAAEDELDPNIRPSSN